MKINKLSNLLYFIGFIFLSYDAYYDLLQQDYWSLFVNLLFLGMVLYMLTIYPKRKLFLNEDMMVFLLIYFSVLLFKSIFIQDYFKVLVSIVFLSGFIAYKLYRKKRKYSFYLKK